MRDLDEIGNVDGLGKKNKLVLIIIIIIIYLKMFLQLTWPKKL